MLKSLGVRKGDTVSIYLPMTWHAVAAFMACARIGSIHSVVFAGFSAESLRDRITDCKPRVVITSDEGKRGGKTIATKDIVDAALKDCPFVEHVVVLQRTGSEVSWTAERDLWWHEETAKHPSYCPPEVMAAEDPLFILYVSHINLLCGVAPVDLLPRPQDLRASQRESFTPPVDIFFVQLLRSSMCSMFIPTTDLCAQPISVGSLVIREFYKICIFAFDNFETLWLQVHCLRTIMQRSYHHHL
jgi:hypothetical protein